MPTALDRSLRDVEELRETRRSSGWAIDYRRLKPASATGRIAVTRLVDVAIERESWAGAVQLTGTTSAGSLTLIAPRGGERPRRERLRVNGRIIGADELILLMPGCTFELVAPRALDLDVLRIPSLAIRRPGDGDGRGAELQIARPLRRRLQRLIACAWAPTPGSVNHEARLAEAIIDEVDALVARASPLQPETSTADLVVRRARRHIEAHLDEEIGLEDLCRATGMRERSLRRAFHEALGVSPSAYLQARRLQRARECLQSGEFTVTAAALAAGLTHLGRFAGRYREMFGELPRETLRRSAAELPKNARTVAWDRSRFRGQRIRSA